MVKAGETNKNTTSQKEGSLFLKCVVFILALLERGRGVKDGLVYFFSTFKWAIFCVWGVRMVCALFSSFWQCKKTDEKIGSEKRAPQCLLNRGRGRGFPNGLLLNSAVCSWICPGRLLSPCGWFRMSWMGFWSGQWLFSFGSWAR